jgi:predicted Zn-dependent protease
MFRSLLKLNTLRANSFTPTVLKRHASYIRFANRKPLFTELTPTKIRYAVILSGGLGALYIANLEEAPVSHRRRLIWLSEGLERKLGDYSYKQLKGEFGGKLLPHSHPVSVRIERVFKRLLQNSDLASADIDWEINVINDPNLPPNAFVLPNGKIFIFSSMISICGNDDGLATVLGHEFAHKLARHTAEQISKTPIYLGAALLLNGIFGSSGNLNNMLVQTLFKLPASREMESEADYIGLMLMSKACYEPTESIKLWERMKGYERSHGGARVAEFLSTHPGNERRIQNLGTWMPKAVALRDQTCVDYQNFRDFRLF